MGIIGLGYVGLPLAGAFARAGVRTIGLDTDPAKIDIFDITKKAVKTAL